MDSSRSLINAPLSGGKRAAAAVALVLLILLAAIHHPVRDFAFLNFDDDRYLENNPWLAHGFTWESLKWAFSAHLTHFSGNAEYWSPLTLLSRLADAQLHGRWAGGHHMSSVCWHALNAFLLFLALRSLTQSAGRSALVALIFAVHPQNMEPVVWLSARKDLVSAAFFFLTLWAYGTYARRPGWRGYALLVAAFVGGVMSKPMVVSTPCVLLLLDVWPLRRAPTGWEAIARRRWWALLIEKLPLIALALFAAVLAVIGQHRWGALKSVDAYPPGVRVGNAVVSAGTYLRRMVWPDDLAIFYPHPAQTLTVGAVFTAAIVLLLLAFIAIRCRREQPWLAVGYGWFLVALLPVIGLVQIGNQAMADRYAYPSTIGILIAAVWSVARLAKADTSPARRLWVQGSSIGIVAVLTLISMRQVQFWRDSETVFTRALAVTERNYIAHADLGGALLVRGEYEKARDHFARSAAIRPDQARVWINLAAAEAALGHRDAAIRFYLTAEPLAPNDAASLFHLGVLLAERGDFTDAETRLRKSADAAREWGQPLAELGNVLATQRRWSEARAALEESLAREPDNAQARALLLRVAAEPGGK